MQTSQDLLPLLLLVGEACNGTAVPGSTELLFASAVSQLREAAEQLTTLSELILNLLQQLGALCSEQTRKSTVISGKTKGSLAKTGSKLWLDLVSAHHTPSSQRTDLLAAVMTCACHQGQCANSTCSFCVTITNLQWVYRRGVSTIMNCSGKILICIGYTQGHMCSPAFPV